MIMLAGKNVNDTLIVGNLMRRVMEAFSTFVYKKGIAEISCDDTILQQIETKITLIISRI